MKIDYNFVGFCILIAESETNWLNGYLLFFLSPVFGYIPKFECIVYSNVRWDSPFIFSFVFIKN